MAALVQDLRVFVTVITIISLSCCINEEFCDVNSCSTQTRYLFYDLNPSEGFNLRRDVYMRFAVLARKLKMSQHENLQSFKLVLPPWSHLIHWKLSERPEHIPWGLYFDLHSMQNFAPVVEIFVKASFVALGPNYSSKVVIDEVYILQHFEDMFETGNFEDRMKIEKCNKNYKVNFLYYSNLTSDNVKCLSYHGAATKLDQLLLNSTARTILIDRGEIALHDRFGDRLYWQARRSMRFNKNLRKVADHFRRSFLNSTDQSDGTVLPEDWREERPHRQARGGPYLGVHLRRRDFLRGHPDVPSVTSIAKQIEKTLVKLGLDTVFIATDATDSDYKNLIDKLSADVKVVRYVPSTKVVTKYKDGGVAIIDQIICSHARYFIGTHESTFSFRIQEEREILGFPVDTTFNAFCKGERECKRSSVWKIGF